MKSRPGRRWANGVRLQNACNGMQIDRECACRWRVLLPHGRAGQGLGSCWTGASPGGPQEKGGMWGSILEVRSRTLSRAKLCYSCGRLADW